MRYAVTYNEQVFTTSQQAADLEKCTCVTLENQGDEMITINNGIKLAVNNSIDFENRPDEFINQPFKIVFAGGGSNPKVLLIKKFVKEVR